MAKIKIQGNAGGDGILTITAPSTTTDRTITLPDSTGTLLDTTSTLDATKLSGALPAIDGSNLTGVSTAFPFYKSDGNSDNITISNGTFPFYKADGSADNIGVS